MKQVLKTTVATLALCSVLSPALAEDFHIALIQSVTGSPAFIGVPVREGMQMAIDEINENELIGPGNRIVATYDDDAGERQQSLSLLTRQASNPDNLLIVGPTTGTIAPSAGAAANDLNIPLFTLVNSVAVVEAGPWGFITNQPFDVMLPYIADYTTDVLKPANCSYIAVSDNESYVALSRGFEKLVQAKGVETMSYNEIKLSDIDFSAVSVKVVDENPECLFVSATAAMTANIIIQARQAGLDPAVKIIGHNALASPQLINTGGSAVEGVYLMADWMPGGKNDAGRAFAEAYEARFGRETDNWAPVGYSQMMVIADAFRRVEGEPTREKVRDALASIKDVPVIIGDGVFNLDEKRIPHYGMSVLQVQDGSFAAAPQ